LSPSSSGIIWFKCLIRSPSCTAGSASASQRSGNSRGSARTGAEGRESRRGPRSGPLPNSMSMKRASLEISLSGPTHEAIGRARIVAKPSQYQRTRYWVVLPGSRGRRERWLLVPTPEEAIGQIARWLLAEANRCFEPDGTPALAGQEAGRGCPEAESSEDNVVLNATPLDATLANTATTREEN
jgi:hypothetical protein